jgi:hypothetical protein
MVIPLLEMTLAGTGGLACLELPRVEHRHASRR